MFSSALLTLSWELEEKDEKRLRAQIKVFISIFRVFGVMGIACAGLFGWQEVGMLGCDAVEVVKVDRDRCMPSPMFGFCETATATR